MSYLTRTWIWTKARRIAALSRLLFGNKKPLGSSGRRARLSIETLEERTVPTLLGQQLFPSNNPWNQPITNAPVAANSTAIINNIVSIYGNGKLHPDFTQDYQNSSTLYGIPYNVVHGNSMAKVNVVIDNYPGESDIEPAPVPANAVLEGDYQNGPAPLSVRGDSHLIIWDEDNNIDYEFYHASRPSENSDGQWHAAQETVWNMNTNTFRTIGYTSADAAGLPILPGLARPDEGLPVSQGGQGVIDHAIRVTMQNAVILDQFLYPASHVANAGNTNAAVMPPMGERLRLKASVNISTLNPESQIIALAMQDYGLIIADNGSNFFFSGASASVDANNQDTLTWDDNDIQDTVHGLKSLTFSDFEVVNLTPSVSGLSTTTGSAGTSVTVTGQNFSGAAGRLEVLFGSTPATSVSVVDDGHVVAVAPAGSGTVDVRVQSGITIAPDSQNYENTIFGYGISATNSSDLFTYGSATSQPPTVAIPASALPDPVTSATTTLNVLGADTAGAASLIYTWSSTGPAPVSFSVNATNAAQTTTASFSKSGSYVFVATITDPSGLSTTSSATVTVNLPPPSVAAAASASPAVVNGTSTTLSVLGADVLGQSSLTYTWSSTGPAPVSFTLNDTNAAKADTATFSQPGNYALVATITDANGLSTTSSVTVTVNQPKQPPTVAVPASASPNPVTSATTTLNVLGADAAGAASLTYTWSSTGPAPVSFSVNGTNAAQTTTATFSKSGSYAFVATITDPSGLSTTSSATVTVNLPPPTVAVAASASPAVVNGTSTTLSVLGADVLGQSSLTYTWSSTGPAPVSFTLNDTNAAKADTATFSQPGNYALVATITDANGLSTTSSVTVTVNQPKQPPTVAVPASASPNPVTSATTTLNVLGADTAGAASLTYTWSSTGPAPVSFSVNGTNAAQTTTASFSKSGSYAFVATITDPSGLSTTSSVTVTVNLPPPTLAVAASASPAVVNGTTTALSVLGADVLGESSLTYTWSSTGPAPVTFAVNGTNAAKADTATFSQPGNYDFVATITDANGLSTTSSVTVTVNPANQPPTVATGASASPNPVNGTTTTLNVLGADAAGESSLIYTWSSMGPASVSFSANGTNAAKNTTATFTMSGNYVFVVTIADPSGLNTTNSVTVSVTVPVLPPTVAVPASASPAVVTGTTTNLSVLGADAAGESSLTYTWSSMGPAPVSFAANGTNAAKNTVATFSKSGAYTFEATITDATGLSTTSSVSVTVTLPSQPPTVATPASASPSVVKGKTTTLSVLGADAAGEASLTYTWAVLSQPPGATAPSFSINGTNTAKSTVATFSRAGKYTFQVTITDAQGLTATSAVSVTVKQTVTTITITPETATVNVKNSVLFSALAYDQFGAVLNIQPTFTWSVDGRGTLIGEGRYEAPRRVGGPYTIVASAGGVKGSATVTVTG